MYTLKFVQIITAIKVTFVIISQKLEFLTTKKLKFLPLNNLTL